MLRMRLNKKDTRYYLTKRYVVSQLLPHMTDDPCLRRVFTSKSPYLNISEFQYLTKVF